MWIYIHAATVCSLCLSNHNHQVDYFCHFARSGYVWVAIIHRTLTWTAASLSCAQMLMHEIAHRGIWTWKESLHWKLTLGRKSFAAPGNWTCVSGVMARCSNQLRYIPCTCDGHNDIVGVCVMLQQELGGVVVVAISHISTCIQWSRTAMWMKLKHLY